MLCGDPVQPGALRGPSRAALHQPRLARLATSPMLIAYNKLPTVLLASAAAAGPLTEAMAADVQQVRRAHAAGEGGRGGEGGGGPPTGARRTELLMTGV